MILYVIKKVPIQENKLPLFCVLNENLQYSRYKVQPVQKIPKRLDDFLKIKPAKEEVAKKISEFQA